VKTELPGIDKNQIEVDISGSELILKGEKKKEEKIEEKKLLPVRASLWRLPSLDTATEGCACRQNGAVANMTHLNESASQSCA